MDSKQDATSREINAIEAAAKAEAEARFQAQADLKDLLLSLPLYAAIEHDEDICRHIEDLLAGLYNMQFDQYCMNCKQLTTWLISPTPSQNVGGGSGSRYWGQGETPAVRVLSATCLRKQHYHTYVLIRRGGTFQKIGQWPSMADIAFGPLKDITVADPEDRKELGRALGLFAHDTPLGAFVYLRRVFERMITRAYNQYADDHGKIDGWRDMRMGDRIKALGDALPNEIVANAGVFGLLSKGIHELSDTDAEALFPLVKAVIFQMLGDEQRHLEAKRARRDIDAALQSAIAKMASGNG